jgi:hypothetical protein
MTSAISPDHHVDIPAGMLESESPPVEPPEVVSAAGQGTSEITAEGAGNGQDAAEQIPTSSSPPKSTPELEGNQDELPPLKEELGNENTAKIIGSEIPDSDADETSIGDGAKYGDEKIATKDGESRGDGEGVGDQADGEKGAKDGNDEKDEKDEKKNSPSSPLGTRLVKDTFSASVSTVVDDSSAVTAPATTGDTQNLTRLDNSQPSIAPGDADGMMAELKTITAPATTGDAQILTKLDSSQSRIAPADADGMMAELKSLKIVRECVPLSTVPIHLRQDIG